MIGDGLYNDVALRFLFPAAPGESLAAEGSVPQLNEKNRKSGVYLAYHPVFANCRIFFIAYARNKIKDDKVVGTKVCFKVTAGSRIDNGSYEPPSDVAGGFSMELELDALQGVLSVLTGKSAHYRAEIPRPGGSSKVFTVKRANPGTPGFYCECSYDGKNFNTAISPADAWHAKMIGVTVLKTHYPWISDDVLLGSFIAEAQEGSTVPESSGSALPGELGAPGEPLASEKQRRTIYAIGVQNGFRDKKDVIEYIQSNVTVQMADRIIKAGNAGDMSKYREIEEYLARNSDD